MRSIYKSGMLLTATPIILAAPNIGYVSAYVNTLTDLIGPIYAALNVVSREMVGFIPSVSRNSGAEQSSVGKGVTYHIAPPATGGDVVASMTPSTPADKVQGSDTMLMTKARKSDFYFTGEEQLGLDNGVGYNPVVVDNIAESFRFLVNEIELDLAIAAAAGASRAYGVSGTTPFSGDDYTDVAQLRKILDDNGAPKTNRSIVANTSAGALLRAKPTANKANEAGSSMTLRDGELLDIHGFSIKETGQPVDHTAGTGAAATTDAAGYAVGETTINLAVAGTGTILTDDVVEFAGDSNKYVIVSGDTNVADGGSITIAAPGLRVAIPAGATAITVNATYAANVGFSRDALHLATRVPATPKEGDLALDSMLITDPRSGLVFQLRVIAGDRMVKYELSIVWGVKAANRKHLALLLG